MLNWKKGKKFVRYCPKYSGMCIKWKDKWEVHTNAHILHCKLGGDLAPFMFRKKLISQLTEKYGSDTESSRRVGKSSLCETPFHLMERRFPSYVPTPERKQYASRHCVVCKKKGTRKQTRYHCVRRDVELSAAPCFERYKLKNF